MESSLRPKHEREHRINGRGRTYPLAGREHIQWHRPAQTRPRRRRGFHHWHRRLPYWALGVTEQDALRIVRTALDQGINFLDNCWDYNDGASEDAWGKLSPMATARKPS